MKIAVVAIDPSSPISGGALLGDRIRMRRHTEDEGVFIRSMANRGHLGGLSKTTRETVLVFDAMGYDVILIETVAVKGRGIIELVDAFWQHRKFLLSSDQFADHSFKWEFQFFRRLVMEMAADRIFSEMKDRAAYTGLFEDLKRRKVDPFSAAERLVKGLEYKHQGSKIS